MEEMTGKSQTLGGYYKGLQRETPPKKKLVNDICERCGVEPITVLSWINGRSRPSKEEYYDVLTELTGIPKHLLFGDENA